jgi:ElaA protein
MRWLLKNDFYKNGSKNMQWHLIPFNLLTTDQLYQIIQLRIDIFVVEQQTMYSDLDDKDRHPECIHLFAYQQGSEADSKKICAYLRILPPSLFDHGMPALGRVVISAESRGRGLGHNLVAQGIYACERYWPGSSIKISAQSHLQPFYQSHGFVTVGEGYLEDGLPHVAMIHSKKPSES